MSVTIRSLTVATQVGTERTIYATWKAPSGTHSSTGNTYASETDHYVVYWYYMTGSGVKFDGSNESTTSLQSVYTAPSNAIAVQVKVKPVSKTYKKDDKDTSYYTGEATVSDRFTIGSDVPTVSSVSGVTNISLSLPSSVDGTVLATWNFGQSNVDHYEVHWYYTIGTGDLLDGGTSTETLKSSTYSYPSGANRVKVKITPVSTTYKWGDVEISYWEADSVTSDPISVSGGKVSVPAIPVVDGVTNLEIGQENNTTNLYVKWSFSEKNVDYYEVQWYYATGDGFAYDGGSSQISSSFKNATYSPPSNAKHAKASVTPVALTYTYDDGNDYPYWTSETVTSNNYVAPGATPDQLSAPDVEFTGTDGHQMQAQVSNINDSSTDYVEFQFYKGDGRIATVYAEKVSERATAYCAVSAGGKYRARCRGINSLNSGYSNYGGVGADTTVTLVSGISVTITNPVYGDWSDFSEEISPGPDTPTDPACSAYTESSIKMTWKEASGATGYVIQYSTDIEYLKTSTGDVSTYTVDTATTTAYVTGLDSGNKYYLRVKATNDSGESGWSDIVSAVIGTTPEPPTTWSAKSTGIIGETINLYWVHNCEDGSDQTSAIVKLTVSGSTTLKTITGDSMMYTLDTASYSDGDVIQWSVCTAGITEEYSEYSVVRSITVYSPATLAITMSSVLSSYPLQIGLEAGPASQKVVGYFVSITAVNSYETTNNVGSTIRVNRGEEIYSVNLNISTNPFTLELNAVSGLRLEAGEEYKVTATVSMNSGLTAETTGYFVVTWTTHSYIADASLAIDSETLTAYIAPYCETYDEDTDENTLTEGVFLSVYRREPDGTFTEIGTDIANIGGGTVIDPHPALDYARYRICVTEEATGAISYSDLPDIPIGEYSIVIQWDEEWTSFYYDGEDPMSDHAWTGSMLKLPYNIDVSENHSPDVALIEYIGREHPVSYYGTQKGETASWSCEVPKDDEETIYALRRLAIYMGDVYVREPSGTGYWAQVTVSMNTEHCKLVVPVSFEITRVEGGM